jgi:hypothetical protein
VRVTGTQLRFSTLNASYLRKIFVGAQCFPLGNEFHLIYYLKRLKESWWLMAVILVTWEAEIGRIVV